MVIWKYDSNQNTKQIIQQRMQRRSQKLRAVQGKAYKSLKFLIFDKDQGKGSTIPPVAKKVSKLPLRSLMKVRE
jgi:hypothetical protein